MTDPRSPDRPEAAQPSPPPPAVETAPPLAPASEQSPWWSAPSGKPFNIPDFAHELRALFVWLVGAPQRQPIPVRIRSRRR